MENKLGFNHGLRPFDPTAVSAPDVTLTKVTHLDLDQAMSGAEFGRYFMVPRDEGFWFVSDLNDIASAYKNGELYVVSGGW
ncbi:hypothetical protein C3369_07110 [Escherichia sp. ESNIH1]|uniref:hypothetical protein n=1 Tax=Escherichia sp. ESNIH1 TaxID=1985876 RepID=UPI000CDE27A0|nr:hypothetical protein [Escherichia sp. ESNIH1]POU03583.1 hypothetical protein C3369_07110 [Escherichia sp. ESNIH1]